MLSTTLKDYKGTYESKLKAFLADYEDNSEKYFFQLEFAEYLEYYNSLINISALIKEQLNQNTKEIVISSVKANELKRINSLAYDNIMARKIFKVKHSGPPEFLFEGIPPSQLIVDSGKLENHISSANAIMEFISNQPNGHSENIDIEKVNPANSSDENKIWFKVGLLFANGTMEKYYNVNDKGVLSFKDNFTVPKIAKELGNVKYNKYILGTIQNYSIKNNGDKNIFNSRDKMEKIIAYCKQRRIDIIPYFIDRMPPI